jgi:branched-chain amino acid transport system substrate-binding protein
MKSTKGIKKRSIKANYVEVKNVLIAILAGGDINILNVSHSTKKEEKYLKKNRYLFLLLALLLVGLLAVGCGGTKETPQGDTIKIGFLGAKTGGHAHYGIETLKGMQMAVEDINSAGGVNGKKLEIVEGDHGSSSSEAANVTQKLITQKVSAIVGDPTTGITKAAAQICQPAKVVLLSAGAVGPDVVEIGDYIYRDTLLDAVAAPAVTRYLAEELNWKKVALVTTTGLSYSEGLTNIFKPALADYGIEIVAEQSIMEKDTNFSAQVTALSQKEFELLGSAPAVSRAG